MSILPAGTRVWSVVGGQAGSEGKGKVAALLALTEKPDYVVCAFGPNAGHTAYAPDGEKHVFHQLPVGALHRDAIVCLGPGSVLNLPRLIHQEMRRYSWPWQSNSPSAPTRYMIDGRAVVVTEEERAWERDHLVSISSTTQGTGAAIARRLLRNNPVLARDVPELAPYIVDVKSILKNAWQEGARIQIEGSQGADLDLLLGFHYPHVTSRYTTAAGVALECGFPPHLVEERIVVFRTFPIRVGNVIKEDGQIIGDSGPYWSTELTWDYIRLITGLPIEDERTTTTGKIRRIFDWSDRGAQQALWLHGATQVWISFADYLSDSSSDLRGVHESGPKADQVRYRAANKVRGAIYPELILGIGTGPLHHQWVKGPKR